KVVVLLVQRLDVLGTRTLRILHEIELYPLTLRERFEPGSSDGRVMNEDILLSAVGLDEAEALVVHEALYGACLTCHCRRPLVRCGIPSYDTSSGMQGSYFERPASIARAFISRIS